MTAFSSKTYASTKSMRNGKRRQETRGTGPLSKHMEPRNFQKMKVLQKNTSRYFRPRVKLRTDMLHKVLYKLKKEQGALDHSLERLEMISNFGETKLQIDYKHTGIVRDLNIKANPKNAYVHMPLKRKKKKKKREVGMRKVRSAMPKYVKNINFV